MVLISNRRCLARRTANTAVSDVHERTGIPTGFPKARRLTGGGGVVFNILRFTRLTVVRVNYVGAITINRMIITILIVVEPHPITPYIKTRMGFRVERKRNVLATFFLSSD